MKKLFIVVACVIVMASCSSPKTLYSWYDSEDASYKYTKRGTEKTLEEAMEQYQKVIMKQKGLRKTVPPGVNAEYGYLLYKAGKKEEGLALLKAEMKLYPESETFISRFTDIYDEMEGEDFNIDIFSAESKKYTGKFYMTCDLVA